MTSRLATPHGGKSLTHMIRDITIQAFEKREASDTLKGLYEAFKTVLLPQLPTTEFADMFAQTLAYGLFAARYNHRSTESFNRRDAAKQSRGYRVFQEDFSVYALTRRLRRQENKRLCGDTPLPGKGLRPLHSILVDFPVGF